MINTAYRNQVRLLLSVLPEVARENCFALHGGTAINLFIRDMPRLSVDIDLTYVFIDERKKAFAEINAALARIRSRILAVLPGVSAEHKAETLKLIVKQQAALVKIEVNQISRGLIDAAEVMPLCQRAQEEFDMFCAIPVVPYSQLYGGKICAALDRQHPRDLFDVKYLLEKGGVTTDIMKGFIYCLLSHERPAHEILLPYRHDQTSAYMNQFAGMTEHTFSYEDYLLTRENLISSLHKTITREDKAFILSFHQHSPSWEVYDFSAFPSIRWKLQNLKKLQDTNPEKWAAFQTQLKESVLGL